MLYTLKEALISLFVYPTNKLEHMTVDYDAYWVDKRGEALGALTRWQRQRADLAAAFMEGQKDLEIADVGCGDGSVLAYLKEKLSLKRIIGLDVSSTALVKARAQGVETILVGNDLVGGSDIIPAVDYVLLFEVLEHMPAPERFLDLMLSKSKHGVVFSFPNTGHIRHRLRLLFGRFPLQWRLHPSEHLRFWTYTDLLWWLSALGYTKYSVRTYEGVPILKDIFPSLFARGLLVYLPKQK